MNRFMAREVRVSAVPDFRLHHTMIPWIKAHSYQLKYSSLSLPSPRHHICCLTGCALHLVCIMFGTCKASTAELSFKEATVSPSPPSRQKERPANVARAHSRDVFIAVCPLSMSDRGGGGCNRNGGSRFHASQDHRDRARR